MENIFGIPMTSIMNVLLVALGLCLLVGAYVLIRNRVIFRMGVRNIPRRPAQTVLIIIGLMLSTLIVAAALTTGDTLNHSIRSDVYKFLGQTDQMIVRGGEGVEAEMTGDVDPVAGMAEDVDPPGTDRIQVSLAVEILQPDAFAAADRNQRQLLVIFHLGAGMPEYGKVALHPAVVQAHRYSSAMSREA